MGGAGKEVSYMFVLIRHTITDSRKWGEIEHQIGTMVEQGQLPKGIKPLFYLPATDGRVADCAWETESLDGLKRFLEPLSGTAGRNEYYQISVEHAFGLPMPTTERVAVH
jgi:hypothetical protein